MTFTKLLNYINTNCKNTKKPVSSFKSKLLSVLNENIKNFTPIEKVILIQSILF